jgi:threonine dehydrogenase-like Zn-dependent dehydrogenase
MLAAVLQAPRRVVLNEVPEPALPTDGVRVRVHGAGICASELPMWEGREWFDYPRPPGEPGHEGWGAIEAVGQGVKGLAPGQRVAIVSGKVHAELALVSEANVVALPESVAPDMPFPGEPLACAMNAMRRAGVQPGQRVAVIGCGFQGLLLVQLCARMAAELLAVSGRAGARWRALQYGASRVLAADDPQLLSRADYDVVFEATGYQAPLDLASQLVRARGRLVIVGYHQDGRRTVDMQSWNWRGLDVINAHEREEAAYVRGLRDAVAAVAAGRLDPGPLLTHSFSLEELGEAYRVSAERPDGFIKAVWQID